MQQFIIDLMNQWGYLGVSFLIALENIFPPIPSEVILTFGGFMTTTTNLNIVGMVIASTIGSVIGAIILYLIGSLVSEKTLEKWLTGKIGKILHIKLKDIRKAEKWFDEKGIFTVFFCRFIPVVRSLISIPAGIARMKWGPFLLFTTLGSLIWNTILISLGSIAGEHWETIVSYVSAYSKVGFVILIVVIVIAYLWYRKKTNKQK